MTTAQIAMISLIIAIISPIVSSLINGIFLLLNKRMEYRHEIDRQTREFIISHKAQVIERYIQSVGKAVNYATIEAIQEYGESYAEIYFYSDQWELIERINTEIKDRDFEKAAESLGEFVKRTTNPRQLKPMKIRKRKLKLKTD